MAQICDYSSLIFAGNTTVLLILALTTDYWEYRGLDVNKIIPHLMVSRDLELFIPYDTTSYLQVTYRSRMTTNLSTTFIGGQETYHAPLFLKRRIFNVTLGKVGNASNQLPPPSDINEMEESEFNLFQQYGNLFRDCDALEATVRVRIGLLNKRPHRCEYFSAARKTSIVYHYAPELAHIESAASATALLCIISVSLGSCCGAYGLFVKYPCFSAYHVASCFSLSAGFLLTLGITLFHCKCYILRKMEIMPNEKLPFRDQLNDARLYSYGWSFTLAWICVFFCYISSYVWLTKSQGSKRPLILWHQPKQSESQLYITDVPADEITDIATI